MEEFNPIIVALLFVLRCLVPLLLMLAATYLLRRWGLIKDPPPPPAGWNGIENGDTVEKGGIAHGKI